MIWMQTYTGNALNLARFTGWETDIQDLNAVDIAFSLASENRFAGHALRNYSVGEHSLLVLDLARFFYPEHEDEHVLALVHDFHECVSKDFPSPLKEEFIALRLIENCCMSAMFAHLGVIHLTKGFDGVNVTLPHWVHLVDEIALAIERRDVMDDKCEDLWDFLPEPVDEFEIPTTAPSRHLIARRLLNEMWGFGLADYHDDDVPDDCSHEGSLLISSAEPGVSWCFRCGAIQNRSYCDVWRTPGDSLHENEWGARNFITRKIEAKGRKGQARRALTKDKWNDE